MELEIEKKKNIIKNNYIHKRKREERKIYGNKKEVGLKLH